MSKRSLKTFTPYWTVEQVAEYLGFNRQTVWRWAREGTLPCFKIANKFRFRPEEIERWMQRKRQKNWLKYAKLKEGAA